MKRKSLISDLSTYKHSECRLVLYLLKHTNKDIKISLYGFSVLNFINPHLLITIFSEINMKFWVLYRFNEKLDLFWRLHNFSYNILLGQMV